MSNDVPRFCLRPARQSDKRIIKQLVRRARLNPLGLDWERFTIAVDDKGDVVGIIQLKPHGDGSQELASLVVARPWRSRGIAAALVAAVKAQSDGVLWLMCERGLVSFYERFGFETVESAAHMSPYYRRIWQLARLFDVVTRGVASLAIMRWQS